MIHFCDETQYLYINLNYSYYILRAFMGRQAVPMVFPTLDLLRKRPAVVDKEVYPNFYLAGLQKTVSVKS